MSEVVWEFTENVDNIEEVIKKVEEIFQITFPQDYIIVLKNNNGGFPSPNCFDINGNEEIFNNLITFNLNSEFNILKIYDNIKKRLVNKIFPFARDPFGNYLCFDYRKGDKPVIVFLEHEIASIDSYAAVKKVCDTFNELLNSLYEYEEEE